MKYAAFVHPALMLGAALLGLALGTLPGAGEAGTALIEPFLMAMLFFVFLAVEVGQLRRAFADLRFTATALAVNFVWTPLLAYVLSQLFFPQDADLWLGLFMILLTPCTDWYLVFTAQAGGDVARGSSILPLNLLLQLILFPTYLLLFAGRSMTVDTATTVTSILYVLVIPVAAAAAVRLAGRRWSGAGRVEQALKGRGDDLQLLFLCLAIAAMFASQSTLLAGHLSVLLAIILPMLAFFLINALLAAGLGRAERFSFDATTALIFTALARNSPLALALAVAVLPAGSLALLALAVSPLIELPTLAVFAAGRRRLRGKQGPEEAA